jgi:hypothetical protein
VPPTPDVSTMPGVEAPLHIVCSKGLVVTVGIGLTVTLTLVVAAGQTVDGTLVVKVTTAKPEAIVGVNIVVNALVGLKVPEGELQVSEVADPPIVPVRVMVEPAQTLAGGVILTVAGGNT